MPRKRAHKDTGSPPRTEKDVPPGTADDDMRARRARLVVVVLLAACAWGYLAHFELGVRTSYLDDAFIYLHIASNVLDAGTARYFPIAGSPAFLASSPLRLILLVPATELARLVTGQTRSLDVVRWTLVFYGVIASVLFLPFYLGRRRRAIAWWVGAAGAALLGRATQSGLQMEGLLIFWCVWTLLVTADPNERRGDAGRVGLLVALLAMARVEYGLVAAVAAVGWLVVRRERAAWSAFLYPLVMVAVGWVLLSRLVLGVYPIPTSYLSKIMTARLELFAESHFADVAVLRFRTYFFPGMARTPALAFGAGLVAAFMLALASLGARYRLALGALVLVYLVERAGSGNFLWYHENLYIAGLTVAGAALAATPWRPPPGDAVRAAVLAAPIVLFLGINVPRTRHFTWDFGPGVSRGTAYRAIGRHYVGSGRFAFGDIGSTYLSMNEIGIASYFAGAQVWIIDSSGLAQPGNLLSGPRPLLAHFYPQDALRTSSFELARLAGGNPGEQKAPPPVASAYGAPGAGDVDWLCDKYYDPTTGVCLQALKAVRVAPPDSTASPKR